MAEPSSPEQMARPIRGDWDATATGVAAKFDIGRVLHDGPRDADELANAMHSHLDSLYRVRLALASDGVFAETAFERIHGQPVLDDLAVRPEQSGIST
ncbi:MAG: hypothetical protein P4L84_00975 [Isosphaeraceae bacterium]|nr:hypothetical protein [Isosphaeraceae bacterium]